MKIKILSILEKIKDLFELGKWIIMIVLAVSTFTGFKSCSNQKHSKDNMIGILTSKVEQIKTESGKNATQAENWELKYKSLNKYTNELKSDYNGEISRFKAEIIEMRSVIKDLKVREKDVQNYIKNELVSKDSMETNIIFLDDPCKFKLEPIEQEFLSLAFEQDDSFNVMGISYESRNTIYIVLDRKAEPKEKAILKKNIGKEHLLFPNAGWLWGWDYFTTTQVKDTCSKITNLVSIEFDK